MSTSINAVYYRKNQAIHDLVCQEVCHVLLSRGHSVVLVSSGDKCTALRQKLTDHRLQISSRPLKAVAASSPTQQPSVEAEASWLRAQKAQVVISAAVPWACAAAAAAGVCAVCVTNSTGGEATASSSHIGHNGQAMLNAALSSRQRANIWYSLLTLQNNMTLLPSLYPCMWFSSLQHGCALMSLYSVVTNCI